MQDDNDEKKPKKRGSKFTAIIAAIFGLISCYIYIEQKVCLMFDYDLLIVGGMLLILSIVEYAKSNKY